ncbi:MAG: nuclear transport factor 2 family protein [Bacteroidota bacterium]
MRFALLLCLATLSAPVASAQDVADDMIRATVQNLFDGMRAKDTTAIRATMHPEARLMTATTSPAGERVVAETPMDAFIEAVVNNAVTFDERLDAEYPVLIDGPLAVAWTPYHFYAGDQFSHCGTNAFTLAEVDAGWQIVQIVDTRRREGCTPE